MSGRPLYRTADDDPVYREMDRHFDFRGGVYRLIDEYMAEGIARDAAIRLIEDNMRLPRGTLEARIL
jgi:hypothetical protein